jgi:hypothetical protein
MDCVCELIWNECFASITALIARGDIAGFMGCISDIKAVQSGTWRTVNVECATSGLVNPACTAHSNAAELGVTIDHVKLDGMQAPSMRRRCRGRALS